MSELKENIIYEPFSTLEEQLKAEEELKNEIETELNIEGTEEDLKIIEDIESKKALLESRMKDSLINL